MKRNNFGMASLNGKLPQPKRIRAHLKHAHAMASEIKDVSGELRELLKEKPSRTRRKYGEIIIEIDSAIVALEEIKKSMYDALYRFKDKKNT